MPSAGKIPHGKPSLELIEEATQVVRSAPLSALAGYYTGTLPFVLAALYFWGDMSQSAFAGQHLVEASLGLAVLFVWMKFWQARFAGRLRSVIVAGAGVESAGAAGSAKSLPALSVLRRSGRVFASQLALQPFGLFLLALSMVLTFPFAWVYAWIQNLTVLAEAGPAAPVALVRKAAHLAGLWPKQNHLVLLILSGFALFVFLNLASFSYMLPGLIKTLFGIETVFTRSQTSLLNSTFFAAMTGLTYLCVDPLAKAVYTLRCFYGESLESGEDLKAELRQVEGMMTKTAAGVLVILLTVTCSAALARSADIPTKPGPTGTEASSPRPSPPMEERGWGRGGPSLTVCMLLENPRQLNQPRQTLIDWEACATLFASAARHQTQGDFSSAPVFATVFEAASESGELSPSELDQAIRHTIQQRKYTWRAPRAKVIDDEEANEGLLSRFVTRAQKLMAKWFKGFGDWLDRVLRKLFQGRRVTHPAPAGYGWMVWLQFLLYLLIAGAVAALGLLIYRVWRGRRRRAPVLAGEAVQAPPDLDDQNVGAERLPEEGWTKLARELLARGEWRLALRAFYLASLAHLAARRLINLAKFKSNREYERELRRRANGVPELLDCFGEAVRVFERVWYGRQAIDSQLVQQFAANVERVKSAAGT